MPSTRAYSIAVLPRLDRGIDLLTPRVASWIPRSSRGMAMILALFITLATPALGTPLPKADYNAAMTDLDTIETLITQTITALHDGMSQADAKAALPHLQERLQWMRDLKVTAARIDTSHTLRSRNADSQRAQCLIMRAGLMDETFQDVMVNVSMKARGVGDEELLMMKADTIASLTHPAACAR